MNQKMGTHKFRFSGIMPHSWLYKLKGISRSSRKRFPSPKHLSSTDAYSSRKLRETLLLSSSRKIKCKTVYKPSSRLKLSSSSLNSHVTLTTYRNHRSVLTSANAIILDPPLNSHVSLTSSWNHRSKSTVGSSSKPVSSSPSDQNYGFSHEPESKSVDIKALNRVDSEDPSISDNSSPVLQKLKKPKAGSSGIRIRANSPKIARRKTKGRTSYTSKRKGNSESIAIVLTSVDPERDFRESMVEMIVENKMKEQTDLEDLLACYLSLNSSEYHDIIIKAFEKTWFHLTHRT
ncbi:hypothetical protein BRARA_B01150 [Brassica rapa]|uniref:Transcription repressor n=1 Tax=Brassica campestris TaxID=3711 RepID=A0A398A878_BRACM|nr:hypothetical protein BRARA_B01150 [Brassica rapa]